MTVVPVTSADLEASEVSWFAALCSDDYAYLGVPDGALRARCPSPDASGHARPLTSARARTRH